MYKIKKSRLILFIALLIIFLTGLQFLYLFFFTDFFNSEGEDPKVRKNQEGSLEKSQAKTDYDQLFLSGDKLQYEYKDGDVQLKIEEDLRNDMAYFLRTTKENPLKMTEAYLVDILDQKEAGLERSVVVSENFDGNVIDKLEELWQDDGEKKQEEGEDDEEKEKTAEEKEKLLENIIYIGGYQNEIKGSSGPIDLADDQLEECFRMVCYNDEICQVPDCPDNYIEAVKGRCPEQGEKEEAGEGHYVSCEKWCCKQ